MIHVTSRRASKIVQYREHVEDAGAQLVTFIVAARQSTEIRLAHAIWDSRYTAGPQISGVCQLPKESWYFNASTRRPVWELQILSSQPTIQMLHWRSQFGFGGRAAGAMQGSVTVKVEPAPGSLSTVIVPPWATTIERAM